MAKILSYEEKDTWIHRLSGVTKLIFFLLWCLTSMLTYDTRVLAVMLVLALIIFRISRTQWKQVGAVFKLVMVFSGSGHSHLRNQNRAFSYCGTL